MIGVCSPPPLPAFYWADRMGAVANKGDKHALGQVCTFDQTSGTTTARIYEV